MKRALPLANLKIGHATDPAGLTGCTAVLCEKGAVAGMDQRGTAAGTRQTDSLNPTHLVDRIHGVCLCGGSILGLQATDGVMQYLRERDIGFDTVVARVPIVPAAVIFDLALGNADVFPSREMGYQAAVQALPEIPAVGSVGAGTGATVGKSNGLSCAMKGGFGFFTARNEGGLVAIALTVVNSFGDVLDYQSGKILAGARADAGSRRFIGSFQSLSRGEERQPSLFQNTTLAVVATNARLTKPQATKIAQMAMNGIIRTTSPAVSLYDGDVVFVLSLGNRDFDLNTVGCLAELSVGRANNVAVLQADGFGKIPSCSDLK